MLQETLQESPIFPKTFTLLKTSKQSQPILIIACLTSIAQYLINILKILVIQTTLD